MKRIVIVPMMAFVFAWLLLSNVAFAQSQTFGVIESYSSPQDAADLDVGWTRVMLHWGELQPDSPDQWRQDYAERIKDAEIDAEIAAGREVVAIVIGIPDWARDDDLLPQGLHLAHDDPDNTFGVFLTQAAERYQGKITHWIIWNEPDIWDKQTPGHTWDGDEHDFAQLMKISWHILKEADPENVVHLAAMTWFWDANYGREQYLDRLMAILTADPDAVANNLYFDVATAHLYFQPNLMYDVMNAWNEIMAKYDVVRPWWLVETNAPLSDDPAWEIESVTLPVSGIDQANFMGQGVAAAMSAGAERIALFKLIDHVDDRMANPEPFGLVRVDGSRRLGFDGYRTAIQLLDGAISAERERWDAVGQVRVQQADRQTHILFARHGGDQRVFVEAVSDTADLVNATGTERRTLTPVDGQYEVYLPGTPCTQPVADTCMIGGTTYYLQQRLSGTAAPVFDTAVSVDYPASVTFDLETAAPIVDVILTYEVDQLTCAPERVDVPVVPQDGRVTWTWEMAQASPPPGTWIWYAWTLTDADGNRWTTERERVQLVDQRFAWQSESIGRIMLHWYAGDNDFAEALLEAADDTLSRLENEIGILLDGSVNLYVYETPKQLMEGMLYSYDPLGGIAFNTHQTALVSGAPDDVGAAKQVITHELAHLVIAQYGRTCTRAERLVWLDEGLAQYAQSAQTKSDALEENPVESLRTLSDTFPGDASGVRMAYRQSYSVVDWLLQEYGAEKMQALLIAIAEGTEADTAVQQIYGRDLDQLDAAWLAAQGFDAIDAIETTPRTQDQPVVEPSPNVESQPTTIVWRVSAVLLLLLALLLFGRYWINRRRR